MRRLRCSIGEDLGFQTIFAGWRDRFAVQHSRDKGVEFRAVSFGIALQEKRQRRIAAMRFHGRYTDAVMLEQTRRLHDLISAADLETKGQPMFAGFDPPTTLPWLRRTEMWIELA